MSSGMEIERGSFAPGRRIDSRIRLVSVKLPRTRFTVAVLLTMVGIFSAWCASAQPNKTDSAKNSPVSTIPPPTQSHEGDPLGCITKDALNPTGLKEAWQLFTSDGRFRLARKEDFSLPDKPITKRIDDSIAETEEEWIDSMGERKAFRESCP